MSIRFFKAAVVYLVIGVLERRGEGTGGTAGLGGESDSMVLVPLETMQERLGKN